MDIRAELKNMMEEKGLTIVFVATAIGVGGGGWVLFYKDKWADLEVYNDLDGRLVNLFRIVKYHPNAFIEEWRHLLGSREMFLQFLNGTFITDIQKAVQFYFLITRSFGGRGDTFGTVKKTSGGACKSLHNVPKKIEAIHERLDTVMIEGRDFEKLINQYDHEGAFFYCDPPYSSNTVLFILNSVSINSIII